MKNPGVHGTSVEIRAAAALFRRPIVVVSSLTNEPMTFNYSVTNTSWTERKPILLGYLPLGRQSHYEPLIQTVS